MLPKAQRNHERRDALSQCVIQKVARCLCTSYILCALSMPSSTNKTELACIPPHRAAVHVLADLAPLLAGSVPIDRALRIVAAQQTGKREKAAALALDAALRDGRPISFALAEDEKFFGTAAIAAARAGESSGSLAEALGRYVAHLRRQDDMRRKLGSALAYPVAVAVVALVAVGLLLGLVVPRLGALLEALGGLDGSPWPTRFLMSLSGLVRGPSLFAGLGLLICVALFLFWPRKNGGNFFVSLARRLPVVGSIVQQGALARATATLSSLLHAGIPLPDALHLCGPASGNVQLAALMEEVADEVAHGVPMSLSLRRRQWLGLPMVAEVSALGEETGALAEQLEWVSMELESRTAAKSATLLALVEPALIILMALIVGLVASSLFLPVLSLADKMQG